MDGVGGTIKRVVFDLVKSNKITINSEEEFAKEISRAMPSIKSIYVAQDDEIIEPSFVRTALKINATLDVHYVKRSFNTDTVCFLEFHRLSNNPEAFHVHYYLRSNLLACDHNRSSEVNDNECGFCKIYYEEGETWFQCPACNI